MYISKLKISKSNTFKKQELNVHLISKVSDIPKGPHKAMVKKNCMDAKGHFLYTDADGINLCVYIEKGQDSDALETSRKKGFDVLGIAESCQVKSMSIVNVGSVKQHGMKLLEGLLLSYYKFDRYLSTKSGFALQKIQIVDPEASKTKLDELKNVVYSVHVARTLVDTPHMDMNSLDLPAAFKKYSRGTGIKVSVLDKKKISSLKMGGLLAVNMGSETPPTFSILEYKPTKAKNSKPIVLVGKGIVYDTGGLSLKGTKGSMDRMKSDMSGSAVSFGILLAAALNKLPLHIVLLVPATDNRPGKRAYCPGDVITMYDGSTVEVLNTDAEGRMVLADALHYAKKYKPELVMDFATLTGAAAAILGKAGIICMGNADEKTKSKMKESGLAQYERLLELPLWNEFYDMMKSPIADQKNIGGARGGAISAGAFLSHFTDYPWMHFDIAGVSHNVSTLSYRGQGGTGMGIRLIYDFLSQYKKK